MTESLFASLLGMCDKQCLDRIAGALGESNQSVFRGIQAAIAAVLGGVATRAGDPGALRRTVDMAPKESVDWSNFGEIGSDPNSPLMATGRRILQGLFGPSETAITNAITKDSGSRPGSVATLMAMAAPVVLNFLARLVQDGLPLSGLSNILQRESMTIRNALPAGVADLIMPQAVGTGAASPVIAQSVRRDAGIPTWVPIVGLCALALGFFWLLTPTRRAVTERGNPPVGNANRMAGAFVDRRLPNGFIISVPANGMESRLLIFMKDKNAPVRTDQWFGFDRVMFDPGSATIRPESYEQIDDVAVMLAAYPDIKVKVAGFSDNSADAAQNQALAQSRANNLKSALVAKGISEDRVMAEGYGENPGAAGQAGNRGAALQVVQK
jgi:OmpA-OmpF porin, OOP family